jgi:hypothetical protein
MKKCSKCGIEKDEEEFAKDATKKDGLRGWCRVCHSTYDKKRYQANPDKVKAKTKKQNKIIRQTILDNIGHVCISCAESDPDMVTFDHINGGGTKMIKEFGSAYKMLKHIIKNNLFHILQPLCMNCQRIKEAEKRRAQGKNGGWGLFLKHKIVKHYGQRCVYCGETNLDCLEVGHKNDDGAEHKRRVGGNVRVYQDIIKRNYPDNIEITCSNCNHKRERMRRRGEEWQSEQVKQIVETQ